MTDADESLTTPAAGPQLDKASLLAMLSDPDIKAAVVRVVVEAKQRDPRLLR